MRYDCQLSKTSVFQPDSPRFFRTWDNFEPVCKSPLTRNNFSTSSYVAELGGRVYEGEKILHNSSCLRDWSLKAENFGVPYLLAGIISPVIGFLGDGCKPVGGPPQNPGFEECFFICTVLFLMEGVRLVECVANRYWDSQVVMALPG